MANIKWPPVLKEARDFVIDMTEAIGAPPTLRQVFYRLVSVQAIVNTESMYKTLSARTAEARDAGNFPDLSDLTRSIRVAPSWGSPQEIVQAAVESYRRDRTEGQPYTIYVGVEKHGMEAQLYTWFGHLGVPILALGGYASQTLAKQVQRDILQRGRPSVLLYAGDYDPTGKDIYRDFVKRVECFDYIGRVALSPAQVAHYNLPVNPAKPNDPRAKSFVEKYGELVQVELDALNPAELKRLYQEALDPYWDPAAYERILEIEAAERVQIWSISPRN